MKVIIPYKDFKGPELRFCLRGIEKYVDQPEVILIGDKPHWFKGSHIPFKDHSLTRYKSRNIYEKIKGHKNFLFFNDDHFLLQKWENKYHYSGMLSDQLKKVNISGSYRKTIENTMDIFGDLKNFDTHCPIYYESLNLENLDWNISDGYCIKSIYCHLHGMEGEEYPDLKIRGLVYEEELRRLLKDRPYFSTGNLAMNKPMITILNELYPTKSIYE